MIETVETALVVDDDDLMRDFVVETLSRNRIGVTQAKNGLAAKDLLVEAEFDLAFLDLKMPGMSGMQLVEFISGNRLDTLPIVITAFGTVEQAVEAMKLGAYDFLMKPFSPEQVELIVRRARELVELQTQNAYLREELGWALPQGRQIVGQSPAINDLMAAIERVAGASSTVLITGESGTGKELVAAAVHFLSPRRTEPFVRMNCAAVPDALMDSELFGHEKGAFTGAMARRVGRFELAQGGTLLLDEISEMNAGVQAKLLRVLQEREFERVGGTRVIKADCRILATSNRDLPREAAQGRFRQDLYYRLNVVPLRVPPLHERMEDLPLLVKAFVERYSNGRSPETPQIRLTPETMDALRNYQWPGNVRELENLIERLCVMCPGREIGPEMLPPEFGNGNGDGNSYARLAAAGERGDKNDEAFCLGEMERDMILRALKHTGGNRSRSSELLGISVRTLRNKLNAYREEGTLPEGM